MMSMKDRNLFPTFLGISSTALTVVMVGTAQATKTICPSASSAPVSDAIPAMHCPGFMNKPEESECCPSTVKGPGQYYCCTVERKKQMEASDGFFNGNWIHPSHYPDSDITVGCTAAAVVLLSFLVLLCCLYCRKCPVYIWRKKKREGARYGGNNAQSVHTGSHFEALQQRCDRTYRPVSTSDEPKPAPYEAPPPYVFAQDYPTEPPVGSDAHLLLQYASILDNDVNAQREDNNHSTTNHQQQHSPHSSPHSLTHSHSSQHTSSRAPTGGIRALTRGRSQEEYVLCPPPPQLQPTPPAHVL